MASRCSSKNSVRCCPVRVLRRTSGFDFRQTGDLRLTQAAKKLVPEEKVGPQRLKPSMKISQTSQRQTAAPPEIKCNTEFFPASCYNADFRARSTQGQRSA